MTIGHGHAQHTHEKYCWIQKHTFSKLWLMIWKPRVIANCCKTAIDDSTMSQRKDMSRALQWRDLWLTLEMQQAHVEQRANESQVACEQLADRDQHVIQKTGFGRCKATGYHDTAWLGCRCIRRWIRNFPAVNRSGTTGISTNCMGITVPLTSGHEQSAPVTL